MFKKAKNKAKRGFTLIELIIVVAIIAILAAIAVPAFGEIRQDANVSADTGNARTIYSVVTAGIADESITVPATATWYTLDSIGNTDLTDTEIAGMADPKAYQGTEFFVNIDFDGNIKVAVAKAKDSIDSEMEEVYPNPTGRYAGLDDTALGSN